MHHVPLGIQLWCNRFNLKHTQHKYRWLSTERKHYQNIVCGCLAFILQISRSQYKTCHHNVGMLSWHKSEWISCSSIWWKCFVATKLMSLCWTFHSNTLTKIRLQFTMLLNHYNVHALYIGRYVNIFHILWKNTRTMSILFGMIQYVIYRVQMFRIMVCIYSNVLQIGIWTYVGVF